MIEIFGNIILHTYYISVILFVLKEFGLIQSVIPKIIKSTQTSLSTSKSNEKIITKSEEGLGDMMQSMAPMLQNLMQGLSQPQQSVQQSVQVIDKDDRFDDELASAQELEDALGSE